MDHAADVAAVLAAEGRRAGNRRLLRWSLVGLAVVAVAAAGWLWSSGAFRGSAVTYLTDTAVTGDIRLTVVATGTLEPTGQVDVSSTLAGTIDTVDVDYNDAVSRGQVLARLAMDDLDARVKRAMAMVDAQRASRLATQATLDDARAALDRATALKASDGVSQRDVELAASAVRRAEANIAAIDAQLKAAEADLQTARNDFDKATIESPIDGVVYEVNVDPGQSISAAGLAQPMFRLVEDLHQLSLFADIDEADIGRVANGDLATFSVEAWPDRTFSGFIRAIRYAPTVVDGVVNYRAEIRVDNTDLTLRPGMTATAEIGVDEVTNVLTVANAALRFDPATAGASSFAAASTAETAASPAVWVLRDGKPTKIEVTVGLAGEQRTQVTGGDLTAGDPVIVGVQER